MSTKHISIPGHDGYTVTREGAVWSTSSNWRGYGPRELAQHPNSDGYPSVRLIVNGRRKRIAVHTLMAIAFFGPRPSPLHDVRHLNGDKTQNNVSNLSWGTRSQNAKDRTDHGRSYRPNWKDPVKREKWSACMKGAKARKSLNKTQVQ